MLLVNIYAVGVLLSLQNVSPFRVDGEALAYPGLL